MAIKMELIQTLRRLPTSPIIHARTNTILEVMKAFGILDYDSFIEHFGNELCRSVVITTNMKMFENAKWCTKRCVNEPKCNSQVFTMVTQMKRLFFFLYIM